MSDEQNKNKKGYVTHEMAYQQMKEKGVKTWDQRGDETAAAIYPDMERFFVDLLAQSWVPDGGKMVEMGCGTGPILRWFHERGWTGIGVDISATAVEMAREQSPDDLAFEAGDVTDLGHLPEGTFDMVLDGHCYHCITTDDDQKAFFAQARRLLKPGGIVVLNTMAQPLNLDEFKKEFKGIWKDGVIYSPFDKGGEYDDGVEIDGVWHIPTRRIDHWEETLEKLKAGGLRPQLMRINLPRPNDPLCDFSCACVRD